MVSVLIAHVCIGSLNVLTFMNRPVLLAIVENVHKFYECCVRVVLRLNFAKIFYGFVVTHVRKFAM